MFARFTGRLPISLLVVIPSIDSIISIITVNNKNIFSGLKLHKSHFLHQNSTHSNYTQELHLTF